MTEIATPQPPEPQSLDAGTEYVVLSQRTLGVDPHDAWAKRAVITARTPQTAAKQWAEQSGEDGTFVVVPVRNWNTVTLKKNTVTTFEVA